MIQSRRVKTDSTSVGSWLAALGLRLSDWFERWFPDAFALAIVAVIIVFAACIAIGNSPIQAAQWFGAGFWDLVAFTMQMTMIIISGYALATAPPVYAIIRRMATIPKNGKSAAAFVGLFSMLSSLVSWSFSLVFSGLLAREVTHRMRAADYRAVGAAGYLGVGSVWALGLSSSAALLMATGFRPLNVQRGDAWIFASIHLADQRRHPAFAVVGFVARHADRCDSDYCIDAHFIPFASGTRLCAGHGGHGCEIRTACRWRAKTAQTR